MNSKHPALFISRQQAVETQPPSPFIRVLRPRLSVDVDTLRTLDGNEIRLWMLFRDMQQGRDHITPDQRQIAEMLGTAQSSISRRLKVLRALRVIALLPQVVKNRRERQRYTVFAEPAPVDTVLALDSSYLVFLQEEGQHGGKRLRQLCRDELFALPRDRYDVYLDLTAEGGTALGQGINLLPLCNGESPLSKNESRDGDAKIPLSTDASALSKFASRNRDAEIPLSTDASALSKNESRDGDTEIPLSTDASALSKFASRGGDTEIPLSTDASPLSKNESRDGDVKIPLSMAENGGDIYNRARTRADACAPTRVVELNPTGLINLPSGEGGCGGKGKTPFAYLATDCFAELLAPLEAKYGKPTVHAVLNLLKRGRYTHDGQEFSFRTDEDTAAIVLMGLLDNRVNVPHRYAEALLYRAHCGTLTFLGDQHARLQAIRQRLLDAEKTREQAALRNKLAAIRLTDGMVLLDGQGQAYILVKGELDGKTHGGNADGDSAWHGRSAHDARTAIARAQLCIADTVTTQQIAAAHHAGAAAEAAASEAFWQEITGRRYQPKAGNP